LVPARGTRIKVRIKSHPKTYGNYIGVVDKEPFKDTFHFW
jgi:hypothetical protein